MLAVKFMKFLCAHTFKYQLTFNLKKGKVFKKALTLKNKNFFSYWKIKDPFINELNYGVELRLKGVKDSAARHRLKHLVLSMESLICAISKGELKEWMEIPKPPPELLRTEDE